MSRGNALADAMCHPLNSWILTCFPNAVYIGGVCPIWYDMSQIQCNYSNCVMYAILFQRVYNKPPRLLYLLRRAIMKQIVRTYAHPYFWKFKQNFFAQIYNIWNSTYTFTFTECVCVCVCTIWQQDFEKLWAKFVFFPQSQTLPPTETQTAPNHSVTAFGLHRFSCDLNYRCMKIGQIGKF